MFHIFTDYPYAFTPTEEAQKHTKEQVEKGLSKERYPLFNQAVYEYFNRKPLFIVDFAVGSGGYIEDFVRDGHHTLGIDGFFAPKKHLVGSWGRIPNNLLTADITKPLTICWNEFANFNRKPCQFDLVITSHFLEHVHLNDLDQTCANMVKHLKPDGIFLAIISHTPMDGHVSIFDKNWWIDRFKLYNLQHFPNIDRHFDGRYMRYDRHDYAHFFCFQKV